MLVPTFKWPAAQTPVDCWAMRWPVRSARNHSGALWFMEHKPAARSRPGGTPMHGIIYLVGLIVVILAILSFFGLR
jgi:hypothetical protein